MGKIEPGCEMKIFRRRGRLIQSKFACGTKCFGVPYETKAVPQTLTDYNLVWVEEAFRRNHQTGALELR